MIISRSAAETMQFGERLAASLRPGDVIALSGELGAGKTCLVKGIARGLGVKQEITSPTFTFIHEYPPLVHVDLYRITGGSEALNIGIEDYFGGDNITVIEWAERIESLLPPHTKRIRLTARDDTSRQIELT